ncbi:MAG: AlkZ family DNA glycosylase [Anaerolineales bacterium]|nr:AlkZ family DNA glycosylase [Anaerolineales bacterium]
MKLDKQTIAYLRLRNQQLLSSQCGTAGEVVARLGAMQAQDYANALWAIGVRLPGATVTQVEQALADHSIIRTWPMRGTLHFVAAADVRWMLDLLASRSIAGSAGRRRQLEIDEATLLRSGALLQETLQGGRQQSRAALFAVLEANGVSTAGQRGFHILSYHAQTGLLCFGAHEGKQPTFALLDDWVPHAPTLPHAEALAALARRYFTSHGPATVEDLARWAGITLTDARAGLAKVAAELVHGEYAGAAYWMPPVLADQHDLALPVLLLPGFDEYLIGYRGRSAVLDAAHEDKIVPGGNGVFQPMLVIDGQVEGTWKRSVKSKAVRVQIQPFGVLGAAHQRRPQAAEQYGRFLDRPVLG